MKKLAKVTSIIIGAIMIILLLGFALYGVILTPKADKIRTDSVGDSYYIATSSYIDYQESNDCSAYATAYVLRCLGDSVDGKELYPKMTRSFGMMTAHSVVKVVEKQGYAAKAYHGNIDTLKQRLNSGVPIICLVNNGNDTHYIVVVGYDADYVYIVDSIRENVNVADCDLYNRKVDINTFMSLWKNNFYAVNNVYIVIEK